MSLRQLSLISQKNGASCTSNLRMDGTTKSVAESFSVSPCTGKSPYRLLDNFKHLFESRINGIKFLHLFKTEMRVE